MFRSIGAVGVHEQLGVYVPPELLLADKGSPSDEEGPRRLRRRGDGNAVHRGSHGRAQWGEVHDVLTAQVVHRRDHVSVGDAH